MKIRWSFLDKQIEILICENLSNEAVREVINQAVAGGLPKHLHVDFHWNLQERKHHFDSDDELINQDYAEESSNNELDFTNSWVKFRS